MIYDFLAAVTPKKDGSRERALVLLGRDPEREGGLQRQGWVPGNSGAGGGIGGGAQRGGRLVVRRKRKGAGWQPL